MKIFRIAQDVNNLPIGSIVLSDLYRREGNIKILDRQMTKGPFNDKIVYRCFFTNSGREGTLEPRDISKVIELGI